MKKLTILAVLAIAAMAFAQETRFSLRYGLDMSYMDMNPYEAYRYESDTNSLAGFQFGITVDMCGDLFCIQPGIVFRQRGGENVSSNGANTYENKIKIWYLEWPFMLSLRIPFSEISTLRVSAGPHIAFGLFGGIEETTTMSDERNFESAFTKNYFKRFDAGYNLGCGIDVQSFYLGISYSLGLIDISQGKDVKGKVYNRALGIILDYYL